MVLFVRTKNDESFKIFERFANDNKKKINFLIASEDTQFTEQYQKLKELLLIEEEDMMPVVRIF